MLKRWNTERFLLLGAMLVCSASSCGLVPRGVLRSVDGEADEIEDAKEAQSTKRRKIPFIFPDFVIFLAGEISLYLRVLIAFRPSLLSVLQLCISLFLEGVRLICNLGQ